MNFTAADGIPPGSAPPGRTVHIVMPGGVDDPTAPSGGNLYDRRICQGLPGAGWQVTEHTVTGSWPQPGAAARAELARTLAELADDTVVLLDGLVACAVPDVVLPETGRLRVAVLVHLPLGDETGLAADKAAALEARERETLRLVPAVVTTSRWASHRLITHHGLTPTQVHVVTPGVDIAPPAPGTDGVSRLLCVAAVIPRKGQHRLVEALAEVAELPWSCVCVGALTQDVGYVARVLELVDKWGLGDRLRLTGARSGGELEASYATADLMVLASHAETYGMAVTEALARGVPVLTTTAGGLPEAVGRAPDGEVPGILVPPDDPAALTAGLRHWLSEPEVRGRLRAAARRRRAVLDGWETTSRDLAEVLERLRLASGRAA